MKNILENNKSFYFIVSMFIIIPIIIGLSYALVTIFG